MWQELERIGGVSIMIELNTIHLGDCQELMKEIPDGSVDMILQDPPYNTTSCKWEWDIMTVIDELWAQWKRIIKPNGAIVMTASQPFTSKLVMGNLKMFKYEWIWEKTMGTNPALVKVMPFKKHENILIFYENTPTYNAQLEVGKPYKDKRQYIRKNIAVQGEGTFRRKPITNKGTRYPSSVQLFSNPNNKNIHPTQKPVALFEYLIRTYTNEGDTVYDGFSGSGTTAIACRNLKRNFICIEKDEDYWYKSMERLYD